MAASRRLFRFCPHPADGGHSFDWPKPLQEAFRALEPGGRIEVSDVHMEFKCPDGGDSAALKWKRHSHSAAIQAIFYSVAEDRGLAKGCRISSQRPNDQIVPIGVWPKDPKPKEIGAM